jgi:hypothetical protein
MIRVLFAVVLLASSGCGVYHAIFWRKLLTNEELCARYAELSAKELSCGFDNTDLRNAHCAAADCFSELDRNGCGDAFNRFADCLFDTDIEGTCPVEGETRFCEGAESELAACRAQELAACNNTGNCPPPDGFCGPGEDGCPDCNGGPDISCSGDPDCADSGQVCSRVCGDDPQLCNGALDQASCRNECSEQAQCGGDICVVYGDRRTCEVRACGSSVDCAAGGRCVSPNNNLVDQNGVCLVQCDPLSCPNPLSGQSCGGCGFVGHPLAGCIQVFDNNGDIADFVCAPVFASAVGDSCGHGDDCTPGAICHEGFCRELCNTGGGACNTGTCTAIFDGVGVCL